MPTLPMKIGVPLDEMSILFFASLGAAIWLVYLFCQRKFAEPSNKGNGEFIYQLLPRQLATRESRIHHLFRIDGPDGGIAVAARR
jgi:hypothetical protein